MPFWDTDHVSFAAYLTTNSFPNPDHVVICLGGNDVIATSYSNMDEIMAYVNTMVTALQDTVVGIPDAEIIIAPTPYGSQPHGFGLGYQASMSYNWLTWKRDMRTFAERVVDAYDVGAGGSEVSVCLPGLWLDDIYSYPTVTLDRSSRDTVHDVVVNTGTGYIHPGGIGYRQMADAVYSHLMGKRSPARNLLGYSGSFDNAFWGGVSAFCTVADSVADPFGGIGAESLISASGTVGFYKFNTTGLTLSAQNYVLSGWIKGLSGQDNTTTIRFNNHSDADVQAYVVYTHDGSLGVTESSTNGIMESVLYAVDDDWYRFWFSVAIGADAGDVFSYRIGPWSASSTTGDGCCIYGAQLEPGALPGDHLVKP